MLYKIGYGRGNMCHMFDVPRSNRKVGSWLAWLTTIKLLALEPLIERLSRLYVENPKVSTLR